MSEIKICNSCHRVLSDDDFYWCKDSRSPNNGYLKSECKRCNRNRILFWEEDNKEYLKLYLKQYRKQWRKKNPEYFKKYQKQYYQVNKDKIKKYNEQWQRNNRNKKNNKDKVNSCRAKRRTIKFNQHDPTTNPKEVDKLYKLSSTLTRDFGPYHVDHIIPISKDGSSHENNLQIVTANQNSEKCSNSNSTLKGITIHDIKNHPNIFNTIIGAN